VKSIEEGMDMLELIIYRKKKAAEEAEKIEIERVRSSGMGGKKRGFFYLIRKIKQFVTSFSMVKAFRWLWKVGKRGVVDLYGAFKEDFLRFSNDLGRKKPGYNFYGNIIGTQMIIMIYLTFFMQRADALLSSFGENSISGQYVLILFSHFVVIVVDRIIFLFKSIRCKILLQLVTIGWVLAVIHTGALYRSALAEGPRLLIWYLLELVYLYFSSMQICYGYPPFVGQSVLTSKVHWLRGHLFVAYRSIPFFYELSLILDWACTDTTLMIRDWIKVEDVNSSLFVVDCNLHFLKKENRKKGEKQPAARKFFTGTLVFLLLCIVVWLPLALFSTGSITGEDSENEVTTAMMSIGMKR